MIEITKILDSIFSEHGLCNEYFCIKANLDGISAVLNKDNNNYKIEFNGKKPKVILNKFIKIHVNLNYILLTPEKGYISVGAGILPDIPFNYS